MTRSSSPWRAVGALTLVGIGLFGGACGGNTAGDQAGGQGGGGAGGTGGDSGPWVCEERGRRPGADDEPCPVEERFIKGVCDEPRCDAGDLAPNCCPGMFCNAGGFCIVPPARIDGCENDGQCDPGQKCLDRPWVSPETKTCGYLPVDAAGGCPAGGTPFNQRCVFTAPCSGACNEGTVCNVDTNLCEPAPTLAGTGHGCDQVCGATELLVFEDPDRMLFDMCCEVRCACETFPALTPGLWGRHSDIAVSTNGIFVSAYDATYGDLVGVRLNRLLGSMERIDYIDGVPLGGDVVADPAGPRGGRIDPGANVATHTSIALAPDGSPRIAYYDADLMNLKYAAFDSAAGTWSVHVIDDDGDEPDDAIDTGDVGKYPSLLIDALGVAHVTYLGIFVDNLGEETTSPMYARAANTTPTGPGDWTRVTIDPVRTCDGTCLPEEACVLGVGGAAECHLRLEDEPACNCNCEQTCVDDGGPVCRTEQVNRLSPPCDGSCDTGETCILTPGLVSECRPELEDPILCGGCLETEACVDDGFAVCRPHTPPSQIVGLENGVGLFTSLVLHDEGGGPRPTLVYYDRVRTHLRGAVATFLADGDPSAGFNVGTLVCDTIFDTGQFSALAVAPDATLGAVFQSIGGEALSYYLSAGTNLFGGGTELIDNGVRGVALHVVGAYAKVVIDPAGRALVVYADQTDNDLLFAARSFGAWQWVSVVGGTQSASPTPVPLLFDGAYGSFANVALDGQQALISTYQRERDDFDRDISRLVVNAIDLDLIP